MLSPAKRIMSQGKKGALSSALPPLPCGVTCPRGRERRQYACLLRCLVEIERALEDPVHQHNTVTTEYRIHRSMNRSDIALPFRSIKAIPLTNTGSEGISDVLGSHARSLPSSSRLRACECYSDRAVTRRERMSATPSVSHQTVAIWAHYTTVTDDDSLCSGQKTEPNHPEITREARLEIQGIPTFCHMVLARTRRTLWLACSYRCSHRERVTHKVPRGTVCLRAQLGGIRRQWARQQTTLVSFCSRSAAYGSRGGPCQTSEHGRPDRFRHLLRYACKGWHDSADPPPRRRHSRLGMGWCRQRRDRPGATQKQGGGCEKSRCPGGATSQHAGTGGAAAAKMSLGSDDASATRWARVGVTAATRDDGGGMCNGGPGGVGRGGEAVGGLHGRETAKKTLQTDEHERANPNEDGGFRTAWVSTPSSRHSRSRQSEVRTVGRGGLRGQGSEAAKATGAGELRRCRSGVKELEQCQKAWQWG